MDMTRPPKKSEDPERRDAGPRDAGPRVAGPRDAGPPDAGAPNRGTPVASPPAPWDHEAESFGAWLCRHRRVRGIELREIAEDSKIGMTYLQAFEDDRFDILPAPVFAKGFLRQYANYVGLDPEEVVNFYLSAAQHSHEQSEEIFETPSERRRGPLKLAGAVIGAVVAVLILIWFLTSGDGGRSPDPSPPPVDQDAGAVAADRDRVEATADEPPPAATAAATATEVAESAALRLTLDFSGECWVEVAVDGERQIAENKIQGESLVLRADHAIDLKIGDVGVVEAELNGRPFRFDDTPGTKVRNQRIDLGTVAALDDPVKGES